MAVGRRVALRVREGIGVALGGAVAVGGGVGVAAGRQADRSAAHRAAVAMAADRRRLGTFATLGVFMPPRIRRIRCPVTRRNRRAAAAQPSHVDRAP